MDKLLAYLNRLQPDAQTVFAKRCGTTVGYLRKACSVNQQLSEGLCLRIGAECAGDVVPEDLRPDVDWEYLRKALAATGPAGEESSSRQANSEHLTGDARHVTRRVDAVQPAPFPDLGKRGQDGALDHERRALAATGPAGGESVIQPGATQ